MPELKKNIRYIGEHLGIKFEIQNFELCDKPAWTFYLYIHLDKCHPEVAERLWLDPVVDDRFHRTSYNYFNESLISNIDWHCGCTYYEKVCGFDDTPRVIKIGCDYQHSWDYGYTYNEKHIECDAKQAIDSFLNMVPSYAINCSFCGKCFPGEQLCYWGDGYLCNSCNEKNPQLNNIGERVINKKD